MVAMRDLIMGIQKKLNMGHTQKMMQDSSDRCGKNHRLDDRGMTIVEVLVGFVILSIIMGMLSGIIAFASNLYYESVDLRHAEYQLVQSVYSKDVVADAQANGSKHEVDLVFKPQNGSNMSNAIRKDAKLYQINTTHFQDVQDVKEIDMEFYFFHK